MQKKWDMGYADPLYTPPQVNAGNKTHAPQNVSGICMKHVQYEMLSDGILNNSAQHQTNSVTTPYHVSSRMPLKSQNIS